jgi:hypothetical protein
MSTIQATATKTEKVSTQLPPEQSKWVKLFAVTNDVKDYKVYSGAVEILQIVAALPVDQLPTEVVNVLDNLKSGKQEILFN